jgi:peptidoglycan glycosyltransferase (EC 2.4.1.129)/cell elongation-specific peptidoglycan D,D-transpeptidase
MRHRLELKNYYQELQHFKLRLIVLGGVVLLGFGVLLFRFYFLQVSSYEHYHALAENNRISVIPVVPSRGIITDRNGATIAHNFFATP